MNPREFGGTLFKGLDLLTAIAGPDKGLRIPEMMIACNESRTTILRLLRTLEVYGLVEPKERYWKVTLQAQELTIRGRHTMLRRKWRPTLEKISAISEELVLLGILEGRAIVHLDFIEADGLVKVAPAPLTRHQLRVSAMGKLALSVRPDLLHQLGTARLRQEIKEISATGIAWNREESVQGVVVAAYFLGKASTLTPMISVAWPTKRFRTRKAIRMLDVIKADF
ncbi:MAG: IclR family transcriptional regulator C-terminal domain-containing protein [Chthoniobacterales bacterium]